MDAERPRTPPADSLSILLGSHAVRQVVSVLTEERGLSDRDACGLVSTVLRANEVAPPNRSADARWRFVQELLA